MGSDSAMLPTARVGCLGGYALSIGPGDKGCVDSAVWDPEKEKLEKNRGLAWGAPPWEPTGQS